MAQDEEKPAKFHVVGATREEVSAFLASLGEREFRADQILRWVYEAGAADVESMSNLPKALRARLTEQLIVVSSSVAEVQQSADGTAKLLVALEDGERVETVLIPEGRRRTVCVSSQVGCPVGCAFCASGQSGFVRDLSAGEMIEQVLLARQKRPEDRLKAGLQTRAEDRLKAGLQALTNVVFMGIGEPLANFEALARAIGILTAPWGLGLSPRRITVSTVGLPERIRRLGELGLGVNLAISLHASDDLTRQRLIPGARPVREVVAAARDYLREAGREVTFEYVLIDGVNDSAADARELAALVGRLPILVNLIPLNPVAGLTLRESPAARAERFAAELRKRGVRVQERRRRGADIEAACGQLRRSRQSAEGSRQ